MAWQDIVFSVGSWLFIIALLPSIFSDDKPPLSTSLLTGAVLTVYTITYASLHFWLTVASTGLLSAAWLTLAVQKHLGNKKVQ